MIRHDLIQRKLRYVLRDEIAHCLINQPDAKKWPSGPSHIESSESL